MVRLSGFMIMGFLAMTLGQLIEAAYLGMVGADELAAIAFTFPVVMALNALTRGIGVGTGAVLARSVGAGDTERASRLATHGLLLTLAFTCAAALLLAGEARGLFTALGAEARVLELTIAYISIWALGFPAFGLSVVGAGLMRSIGDPATPGWVMAGGALLQILIAPPLIFGWWGITALGIEGAAVAFVIARAVALAMTLWWFGPHRRVLRASLTGLRSSSAAIAHVGLPAAASNLIVPLSTGVITWLLSGFGNAIARVRFRYGPLVQTHIPGALNDLVLSAHLDGQIVRTYRDLAAERRWLEHIDALGFREARGHRDGTLTLPTAHDWLRLCHESLEDLRAAGWEIQTDPGFPLHVLDGDAWYVELDPPQEDGQDWFSLAVGVEVGGERVNVLPAVVQAIHRGRIVRDKLHIEDGPIGLPLPDGRWISLPGDRLALVVDTLVDLFDERMLDDGRLRIGNMDMGRLLALPTADWRGDE